MNDNILNKLHFLKNSYLDQIAKDYVKNVNETRDKMVKDVSKFYHTLSENIKRTVLTLLRI